MQGEAVQVDAQKADRVELILRELDSLPTLSAVAVRLLELTEDSESDARDVIELIRSDPALASKVFALCRCHPRGRASQVNTIDRAVLLLGFDAVRCAVLSVQVFDVLDGLQSPGGETQAESPSFDREAFWLHALAVAVVSEKIAQQGRLTKQIAPGEAYMAGLLHDIGQLVLHVLLPESFDRVCRLAETHAASLDRACKQIIGLDTHTAGKRLAEHWGLPQSLIEVIWLCGQPFQALPPSCGSDHRMLIAIVSLADTLVRSRYISPGAHWSRNENLNTLSIPVGIAREDLDAIMEALHGEVSERADAMGISGTHDPRLLLRSIIRANESLARANAGMRQRERIALRQSRLLRAIGDFHTDRSAEGSLVEAVAAIARSAEGMFETRAEAALFESADGHGWRFVRFGAEGRTYGSRIVKLPPDALPLETLARDLRSTAPLPALMPWLSEYLGNGVELDAIGVLPICENTGSGGVILLLESRIEIDDDHDAHRVLMQCWQTALASGGQHDTAALIAEQLAEANRALVDTQEQLARNQTLATLGEVAAGAAHEMNNPLAIIAGRGQLLASRVGEPELRNTALEIVAQSHRLSDMITALRQFAEPVHPIMKQVDLADLVLRAVQKFGPDERQQTQVNTVFTESLQPAQLDAELIGNALGELVKNAAESKGVRHIELRVQTDPLDNRLKIEVRDDGSGLTEHALRHAFDPFYSAKQAGRQPGLGLARARRFVDAHGGQITLVNGPSGGAVATIWLSDWRGERKAQRRDAA